jgi:hypothetical protein
LVTSSVGTAFYNNLLKESWREGEKLREEEDEHINSYWMASKKREDTKNLNRKHYITIYGALAS